MRSPRSRRLLDDQEDCISDHETHAFEYGFRASKFGILIWPSSAFCFGPPKATSGYSDSGDARTEETRWISDSLRDQTHAGLAVLRLVDPNRSPRTGPLRTGRGHCPPPYPPGISRKYRQTSILVKFIRDRLDLSRTEGTSLAACAENPYISVLSRDSH
jgi:hypothetical protein